MRSSCCTCHTVKMKVHSTDFILLTFISLSRLLFKHEVHAASKQFQDTVYNTMKNNSYICHDGFMSVYISKLQFADLPLTIYVQGKSDTKHISDRWLHILQLWDVHYMLFFVSKSTHRWTQRVLPSCGYSKTVPLLPWWNWNLSYVNSCLPWMFCEKTSKLKRDCLMMLNAYTVYTNVFFIFCLYYFVQ